MAWEFESPPGHQLNVMSRRQVCGSFALTAGFQARSFATVVLPRCPGALSGWGKQRVSRIASFRMRRVRFPRADRMKERGGRFRIRLKENCAGGRILRSFFHADGQRSGWSESLSAADAGTGRPPRRFTGPFFSAERERAFPPCHAVDRRGRSAFPRPVLRL